MYVTRKPDATMATVDDADSLGTVAPSACPQKLTIQVLRAFWGEIIPKW
jgi:hypothetical protein